MTTLELQTLLAEIKPDLERVAHCADDSELDDDHAVADHYDCIADLRRVAFKLNRVLVGGGYLDMTDEAANTLTILRNATWLDDDLDIEKACLEVATYLEEEK